MEEYLTVKELSQRTKLATQTIYNFIHLGKFTLGQHYLKPTPKKILFKWSEILRWMGEEMISPTQASEPIFELKTDSPEKPASTKKAKQTSQRKSLIKI